MSKLKTAVIMAGGKGTRLASITGNLPKPMANIRGTQDIYFGQAKDTILEHQIDLLSENGITDFIFVVGNKKSFIQRAFTNETINRNIPNRNITIRYFEEQEMNPLGTGGSFCSKDLQGMIGKDDFILTYADVLFDINIQDMYKFHVQEKADATMFVGACKEPDDRVLCRLDKDGKQINKLIQKQGKNEGPRGSLFPNVARNGITIFNNRLFETLPSECTYMDMEEDILAPMVYDRGYKVCAWKSPCYVKDIGTVDRFEEGVKELEAGVPQAKNPAKSEQSCAIFRERDLYLEDGKLDKGMASAIRVLNDNGVIVGLQQDVPKLDNSVLGEMVVDTDLIRQGSGAFTNFKFGEEDIEKLIEVMGDWNITREQSYVIEKFVGQGFLVSNFAKANQSFQLSATASAFYILEDIENQKVLNIMQGQEHPEGQERTTEQGQTEQGQMDKQYLALNAEETNQCLIDAESYQNEQSNVADSLKQVANDSQFPPILIQPEDLGQ